MHTFRLFIFLVFLIFVLNNMLINKGVQSHVPGWYHLKSVVVLLLGSLSSSFIVYIKEQCLLFMYARKFSFGCDRRGQKENEK